MHRQRGFTLMELMVVIAIIPILSAIALPDYQRYLDRAALIDSCNAGQLDIPASHRSRYVSSVSVRQDVISLTGRQTLAGLTLVMTPETQGDGLLWQRHRGRRPSCRSVRSVIPER